MPAIRSPIWPLTAAILVLTIYACVFPTVFTDPRFWAEEGSLYFPLFQKYGAHALFLVVNGNYQFLTNALVGLSALVDPLYAPAVTVYASAFAIALVAAQIHWAARDNGASLAVSLLAPLAWAMSAPMPEIILSATNIQWIAGLSVLLLIFKNTSILNPTTKIFTLVWVLLCGLTGVPSCILAPAMLGKGLVARSGQHLVMGILLSLCALFQGAVIVLSQIGNREFVSDLELVIFPTINQVMTSSFLGVGLAKAVAEVGHSALYVSFISAAMSVLLLFCLCFLSRNKITAIILIAVIIVISIAQTIGSIGGADVKAQLLYPANAGRYFATGCLALILLVAISRFKCVAVFVLSIMVLVGTPYLIRSGQQSAEYPSWRAQVTTCSGTCEVEIWPTPWVATIIRPN